MKNLEKEKTLFEIDLLKHLQDHNFFNYNVKHSKYIAGIGVIIALFIAMFDLILNFNQNLHYLVKALFLVVVVEALLLAIVKWEKSFRKDVRCEKESFEKYHLRIKERYEMLKLDVDKVSEVRC